MTSHAAGEARIGVLPGETGEKSCARAESVYERSVIELDFASLCRSTTQRARLGTREDRRRNRDLHTGRTRHASRETHHGNCNHCEDGVQDKHDMRQTTHERADRQTTHARADRQTTHAEQRLRATGSLAKTAHKCRHKRKHEHKETQPQPRAQTQTQTHRHKRKRMLTFFSVCQSNERNTHS